jgi:heat shock protein HslJ
MLPIKLIAFVLLIILCTNCEDLLNTDNKKKNEQKNYFSTKWILKEIQHTDSLVKEVKPNSIREMNIVFTDTGKFRAISSINLFVGDFSLSGTDSIHVKNLFQTEIGSTDSLTRAWEDKYRLNLENSQTYTIDEGTLSIATDIRTIMIFK